MGSAKSSKLVEGCELEIVCVDAEAAGDVALDRIEPLPLCRCEGDACGLLLADPPLITLFDGRADRHQRLVRVDEIERLDGNSFVLDDRHRLFDQRPCPTRTASFLRWPRRNLPRP